LGRSEDYQVAAQVRGTHCPSKQLGRMRGSSIDGRDGDQFRPKCGFASEHSCRFLSGALNVPETSPRFMTPICWLSRRRTPWLDWLGGSLRHDELLLSNSLSPDLARVVANERRAGGLPPAICRKLQQSLLDSHLNVFMNVVVMWISIHIYTTSTSERRNWHRVTFRAPETVTSENTGNMALMRQSAIYALI